MNAGRKMLTAGALATLCAACVPVDEGRIVAAKHFDAPKEWAPIPVMGRDLYLLYGKGYAKINRDNPGLAMFEHPWLEVQCPFHPSTYKALETLTPEKEKWLKFPAKISEVLDPQRWHLAGMLKEFEEQYPGHPFSIVFWGSRPICKLDETYDTDKQDFAEWRKKHPGFHSFVAFDEYDNDQNGFVWQIEQVKDPVRKADLVRQYPLENQPEVYLKWTDKNYGKTKSFHFGSSELYGLWSVNLATGHDIARKGVKFLFYEAEHGSTASPWRWGGMYARGASRQFRIPLGWYGAIFTNNSVTRDKHERHDGMLCWPNPDQKTPKMNIGASRSLIRRNLRYGYFIGGINFCMECSSGCVGAIGDDGTSWKLSPIGEDLNYIFAWNKKHDRGVSYTPVVMLTSITEDYQRQGYTPKNRDKVSQSAFLHTLVPTTGIRDRQIYCNPETGFEGNMWNSEFGELNDVLCPDAGQPADEFLAALSTYPAAFLIGHHNPNTADIAAISTYVSGGGTLFCSYDQVCDGLVGEGAAGVRFGDEKASGGKLLLDENNAKVEEFKDAYSFHKGTPTTAAPLLKDELGNVVAYVNPCGKGRVVTVTCGRMLPDEMFPLKMDWWNDKRASTTVASGERTFPIVHYLLKRVQKDVMPIAVEGDIQWGLNKTAKGWMLWLINNNGIIKYALEPEEFDLTKTATVTVDLKSLKGCDVTDITGLEKSIPVEVKDGKFTVAVKPGENRQLAIE